MKKNNFVIKSTKEFVYGLLEVTFDRTIRRRTLVDDGFEVTVTTGPVTLHNSEEMSLGWYDGWGAATFWLKQFYSSSESKTYLQALNTGFREQDFAVSDKRLKSWNHDT